MTLRIKRATKTDCDELVAMIGELARFYGDTAEVDARSIARDCLGRDAWSPAYIAREDGRAAGYAILHRVGQAQQGLRGMELHHLFVREDLRGRGVGSALMTAVKRAARRHGAAYLVVGTTQDNTAAQSFYRTEGMMLRPDRGPRFGLRLLE